MAKLETYDLAILGDGCSSFHLLHALAKQAFLPNHRVALVGNAVHEHRSWCFWSKELAEPWKAMVTHSWSKLRVKTPVSERIHQLQDYQYHYLPGDAFFNYFNHQLSGFEYSKAGLSSYRKTKMGFEILQQDGSRLLADTLMTSLMLENPGDIKLWQHFSGWFLRSDEANFDPEVMTLMDFDLDQQGHFQFVYILPFSPYEALVEYTCFGPEAWDESDYAVKLHQYLQRNLNGSYQVVKKEQGKIPMDQHFSSPVGPFGELYLGTPAGMVKASTGYAFDRMRMDADYLATCLASNAPIVQEKRPWTKGRFAFYDACLLHILLHEPEQAPRIFARLFESVPMDRVLCFLEEKSNWLQEASIFANLPLLPFLKAIGQNKSLPDERKVPS